MLLLQRLNYIFKRFRRSLPILPVASTQALSSRKLKGLRFFSYGLIIGALLTILLTQAFQHFRPSVSLGLSARTESAGKREQSFLYIAVGSAPKNNALRSAARSTYLTRLDVSQARYHFFTDDYASIASTNETLFNDLNRETRRYRDLIAMEGLASGYGTSEGNPFSRRGLYQMRFAMDHYNFDYYLRIDDDSYLCLDRLLFELHELDFKDNLFWGRYWCKSGRNRADENFMLWSRNVIEWLVENGGQKKAIVPWDNDVTLGWNWGYWSWLLNLTIIDDQFGIDAQQGLLTNYTHAFYHKKEHSQEVDELKDDFCNKYLFAHHVAAEDVVRVHRNTKPRLLYSHRPVRKGRACKPSSQSFLPARHSKTLPSIHIHKDDPD